VQSAQGEFGLLNVAGNEFTVTATEQISGRLDTAAVRDFLGDAYSRFEKAVFTTVIRIKAVNRLAAAAQLSSDETEKPPPGAPSDGPLAIDIGVLSRVRVHEPTRPVSHHRRSRA
jgi:hypothetical protein